MCHRSHNDGIFLVSLFYSRSRWWRAYASGGFESKIELRCFLTYQDYYNSREGSSAKPQSLKLKNIWLDPFGKFRMWGGHSQQNLHSRYSYWEKGTRRCRRGRYADGASWKASSHSTAQQCLSYLWSFKLCWCINSTLPHPKAISHCNPLYSYHIPSTAISSLFFHSLTSLLDVGVSSQMFVLVDRWPLPKISKQKLNFIDHYNRPNAEVYYP